MRSVWLRWESCAWCNSIKAPAYVRGV